MPNVSAIHCLEMVVFVKEPVVSPLMSCLLACRILFSSNASKPDIPEFLFIDININGLQVLVGVCYRTPKFGGVG